MRNDTHWNETPRYVTVGESLPFTLVFEGATTCSSPSTKAYKGSTDVTSTIFPSGSDSASGNTVTLPNATGFIANDVYVIATTVTVDSIVRVVRGVLIASAPYAI